MKEILKTLGIFALYMTLMALIVKYYEKKKKRKKAKKNG